jgi:dUTP pyrophosphatase
MKYIKIRDVKSPTRGTSQSAGIDFYIPNDWNEGEPYDLGPGHRLLIPSGLKLKVPEGYALIAFNKSGIATKTGVIVGACVVDEDYQGEVHLSIINTNQPSEHWQDGYYVTDPAYVTIEPGTKLMQFILVPVNYVEPEEVGTLEELFPEESERGSGGFGSTGIK